MSRYKDLGKILKKLEGREYEEEYDEIHVNMDFENIWDCFSHDGYKYTIRLGFLIGKIQDNVISVEDVVIPGDQAYDDASKTVQLTPAMEDFYVPANSEKLVGVAFYCGKRQFIDYDGFKQDDRFNKFPIRMILRYNRDYQIYKDAKKLKK